LKGQTRIKALLYNLENAKDEKGNDKWNSTVQRDLVTKEIIRLFFSFIESFCLWQRYSKVIYIDATYKVNRYNVLLLSIVGTTRLNTSFYIANIFLVGKYKDDYIWAMKQLWQLDIESINIKPKVIFIDKEDALATAIKVVFLEARQFYYV
jgi:MULE transposase domain